MKNIHRKSFFSSFRIIILGFAAVILLGTIILMLPISTADRSFASFTDALFTATSAVCVTGLITQNTATYWSVFGQCIIITLIQIGGMGVVTVAASTALLSGRKIGLMQRSTMQDALSAPQVGGIVRLTKFILRGTLLVELIGALLLSPAMIKEFGFFKGILYSLFHSVSAFCNAGFDLMGEKVHFSSLTAFSNSVGINLPIILLIIVGGIGFLTWDDIKTHGFRFKKYRMQSKVILATSAILIILPAIYFFFFEFSEMPLKEKILCSLFQSVTARTAGFNTADLSKMSESGQTVMSMLMLVGGSPGSTAGGMKTTTIAVLAASAVAVFRRKEETSFFKRSVSDETVRNAAAILILYLFLFMGGGIVLSLIENLPLLTCLFESASAVGTVGLTLGITTSLCTISKIILILLMFFGRMGGLTIIYAAVSNKGKIPSKLPEEKITVG